MNTALSLAPLFRHTVGFDRVDELLDAALRADQSTSYPPYDIVREGEDTYRIAMAVAGFDEDELTITVKENQLMISGEARAEENQPGETWLHRGIARRAFQRSFRLADHVVVDSANLKNGLLTVKLRREIPESSRPRVIAIEGQ